MRDYAAISKALRCCHLTSGSGCAECPRRLENNDSCYKLLPDAADAIEELLKENGELENSGRVLMAAFARMKEKVPHWISVEEQLPDVAEKVLTYNGNFVSENWLCTVASKDGRINAWAYSEGFVTHWMPLPEAPKEGNA